MSYPETCPYCGLVVDSMDSVADTRMDLQYHIEVKHK